jgi:hypothetical protein
MSDPRTWDTLTGQKQWSRLVEENREQIITENLAFRLQQVGGYALNAAHREITGLKIRLAELEGRQIHHCMERDVSRVIAELEDTGEARPGDVIRCTDRAAIWVRGEFAWRAQQ